MILHVMPKIPRFFLIFKALFFSHVIFVQESRSSLKQQASGLTRDVTASRVVLSCMQTLASSSTSSPSSSHFFSSTPNFKVNRRSASSQKNATSNSEFTRFNEYVQVSVRRSLTLTDNISLWSMKCNPITSCSDLTEMCVLC